MWERYRRSYVLLHHRLLYPASPTLPKDIIRTNNTTPIVSNLWSLWPFGVFTSHDFHAGLRGGQCPWRGYERIFIILGWGCWEDRRGIEDVVDPPRCIRYTIYLIYEKARIWPLSVLTEQLISVNEGRYIWFWSTKHQIARLERGPQVVLLLGSPTRPHDKLITSAMNSSPSRDLTSGRSIIINCFKYSSYRKDISFIDIAEYLVNAITVMLIKVITSWKFVPPLISKKRQSRKLLHELPWPIGILSLRTTRHNNRCNFVSSWKSPFIYIVSIGKHMINPIQK